MNSKHMWYLLPSWNVVSQGEQGPLQIWRPLCLQGYNNAFCPWPGEPRRANLLACKQVNSPHGSQQWVRCWGPSTWGQQAEWGNPEEERPWRVGWRTPFYLCVDITCWLKWGEGIGIWGGWGRPDDQWGIHDSWRMIASGEDALEECTRSQRKWHPF